VNVRMKPDRASKVAHQTLEEVKEAMKI